MGGRHCSIQNNQNRKEMILTDYSKNGDLIQFNTINGENICYYFIVINSFHDNYKESQFDVTLNEIDNKYYLKINGIQRIYDPEQYERNCFSENISKWANICDHLGFEIADFHGTDVMNDII